MTTNPPPMPHNLEAERNVLGAVLLDNDLLGGLGGIHLEAKDFYVEAHGEIFSTMEELYKAGSSIDPILLCNALRGRGKLEACGGHANIVELEAGTLTVGAALEHGKIIKDAATRRRFIIAGASMVKAASGEQAPIAQLSLLASEAAGLGRFALNGTSSPGRRVVDAVRSKSRPLLHPFQFDELNRIVPGIMVGDFSVVSGPPTSGKTSLCVNSSLFWGRGFREWNETMRQEGEMKRCGIFISREESADSISQSFLQIMAGVSKITILKGIATDAELDRLDRAATELDDLPLIIDDAPDVQGQLSLEYLRMRIMDCRAKGMEPQFAVWDSNERMGPAKPPARGMEYSVPKELAHGCKEFARQMGVHLQVIAQEEHGGNAMTSNSGRDARPRGGQSWFDAADLFLRVNNPTWKDKSAFQGQVTVPVEVEVKKSRMGGGHGAMTIMVNQATREWKAKEIVGVPDGARFVGGGKQSDWTNERER